MRPTRADINLDNLSYNLRSVKRFLGEEVKIMAIVKANAYGHGAVGCAKRLEADGVDWFGTATIEEGAELRSAGVSAPILCLGGPCPGEEARMLSENITPVVFDLGTARRIDAAAADRGVKAAVHLKIDTGMGRVGVPHRDIRAFADALGELCFLELRGAMTHFAAADDPGENEFTGLQIERFNSAVDALRSKGFKPEIIDLANSPGAIGHPDAKGNMVRIGGILYGLGGDVLPPGIEKPELRPVMSVRSVVAFIKRVGRGESLGYGRTFVTKRDSLIGTVPIGYQDGYRRGLSNQSRVIVNGCYAPVAGRISMDWTIVDLTDVTDASVDDEVILIGSGGEASITAEDLAARLGTISYEITCGISSRVPRRFVETGQPAPKSSESLQGIVS